MNSIVSFVAYNRDLVKLTPSAQSVEVLLSSQAFNKLSSLISASDYRSIQIELNESSEEYKAVINIIIEDTGKCPSEFVGLGVRRGKEFLVSRKYTYTPTEINDAPALLVLPEPHLVELAGIENGVPTFRAATIKKKNFGCIFPSWRLGVSDGLARYLSKKSLKGLNLIQMMPSGERTELADLYWMRSTIVLPQCMLTTCDNSGQPLGVKSKGCHFIAKSSPLELVYDERAFKAMDFDIAFTEEKIGAGDLVATQLIVISQKFRQILESQVEYNIEYTPVRILQ